MLDEGLDLAVQDIAPIEFEIYGKVLKLQLLVIFIFVTVQKEVQVFIFQKVCLFITR